MGDYRTTAGEAHPVPLSERRSKRLKNNVILSGLILLLALALTTIQVNRHVPAAGYVTSRDYVEVRPVASGTVTAILMDSGAMVKQGDILVQLDDAKQQAALGAAINELQKAEAELALCEAELAESRRNREHRIQQARMTLEHTQQRLELTHELNSRGLSSGRAVAEDTFAANRARAELENLQADDPLLDTMRAEILNRSVHVRKDAVTRATATVEECRIRAPISGRVNRFTFYAGEVVRPDNVLFEIYGGTTDMLKLKVPERFATRLSPGQPCKAEFKSYTRSLARRWFRGHVVELRDVIQSDNQKTYRVIYCHFDDQGLTIPPGTSADVNIYTDRSPLWQALLGL
jgi:HlyD family secretion protein